METLDKSHYCLTRTSSRTTWRVRRRFCAGARPRCPPSAPTGPLGMPNLILKPAGHLRRGGPHLRRDCPHLRRDCPHLRRDCPHLRRDLSTSAPGLTPHLRRDCPASAPGLARIDSGTDPHLRRDSPQLLARRPDTARSGIQVARSERARRADVHSGALRVPGDHKACNSIWARPCVLLCVCAFRSWGTSCLSPTFPC